MIATGLFVAVAGISIATGVLADQRLELMADGLVYYRYLRRKTIPWASIASFLVGRARGGSSWSSWSTLVVELSVSGQVVVGSLVGTRRFVEHVIAEIDEFRAELAPSPADAG